MTGFGVCNFPLNVAVTCIEQVRVLGFEIVR